MTTPRFAERLEGRMDEISFTAQHQQQANAIVRKALEEPLTTRVAESPEVRTLVIFNLAERALRTGEGEGQETQQDRIDKAVAYVSRVPQTDKIAFSRIMMNDLGGVPGETISKVLGSGNWGVIRETIGDYDDYIQKFPEQAEQIEAEIEKRFEQPIETLRSTRQRAGEKQPREAFRERLKEYAQQLGQDGPSEELLEQATEEMMQVARSERRRHRYYDEDMRKDIKALRQQLQPNRSQGRSR